MDEKEILLKMLETLERLNVKVDKLDEKIDQSSEALNGKIDQNQIDTIEAVKNVVDVIGEKIEDIEEVTAQNAFDVQRMKRRKA